MNKPRYFPFERNRYFYGKLLTVRDFMSEQSYYSDKRRLTNRLLFGSGVVSGLQAVAVDDKSVSVETGVALDQLGREIVVPSPVAMKLSMMEGFTNNDYAKNVYLCIAYDEKGKEPVHSIAGASGRSDEVSEHNRILESYRLFIREQPPAPALQEYNHLIEDTSIWYEDAHVRVLQSVPRFLQPGQIFDLRLTIEKTLQTPHVEFQYEPEWANVEPLDLLPEGLVKFAEPTDGGQAVYTVTIRMRVSAALPPRTKDHGTIAAKSGTSRLVVGDRLIYDLTQVRQNVEISDEPSEHRMLEAYYARSLDRAIDSPADPCVYLAKINLLQMGATYAIDSVERIPFDDYVLNPTMLYKIFSSQLRSAARFEPSLVRAVEEQQPHSEQPSGFPDIKDDFREMFGQDEEPAKEEQIATGIVEISIMPKEKKKWYERRQRNFHSEEIVHGLGAGAVLITAGLSDEQDDSEAALPQMWNKSDAIYYGPQDVFHDSQYASEFPEVKIGMIHYPKKGTFRIGVRVMQKTERTRVRIRWWAVKTPSEQSAKDSRSLQLEIVEKEAAASKN
ncbi:hypothetical protein [Paenibacillus thalictri]|uniref:Uncharacterized protein n=1 Tax=Paenibacillus thalictri TaxID=2527873 RepID=A0A4Q9DWI4_9BACL|nr:hypothetical protein [Paenibacillus thalictri]TBL80766.1 hypothetical protein EYB31_05955 [Paenibacillus thalictri]